MLSHDVDKISAELQHVHSCHMACHSVVVSCVRHLNDDKDLTTITTHTLQLLQTSSTSATKGVCQTLTPLPCCPCIPLYIRHHLTHPVTLGNSMGTGMGHDFVTCTRVPMPNPRLAYPPHLACPTLPHPCLTLMCKHEHECSMHSHSCLHVSVALFMWFPPIHAHLSRPHLPCPSTLDDNGTWPGCP